MQESIYVPKAFRQIPEELYPSPIATAELVGRKEELDRIKEAVKDAPNKYIIYITGGGGIGKTKLAQHLLELLPQEMDEPLLVASRPIDMYHTANHTVDGFIRALQGALSQNGAGFEEYLEKRKEFYEIKPSMIEAFIDDLNRLAKERRTVFVLDTVEKFSFQEDPVARRLGISIVRFPIYEWLVREFLPKLQNTVVIMAGRPAPLPSIDDLEKLGTFLPIKLQGLKREENFDYFEALEKSLRKRGERRDIFVAERIEQWDDEYRGKIFHCLRDADGTVRPILLAIAIDYLAITGEPFPAIEEKSLSEAQALSEREREGIRNELLKGVEAGIREASDLAGTLISTLAWLTKGADRELLARILGLEPEDKELEEACERLKDLSFVKIRPLDNRFFLHDEMYRLLRDPRGAIPDGIFRPLEEYYKERIRHLKNVLLQLYVESAPQLPNRETLDGFTAEIQDAMIEDSHYRLHRSAVDGFVAYCLYSDEAIAAANTVLDTQLQAELLGFLAERDPTGEAEEVDGLRRADVLADAAIRWVRRLISQGKHEEAREVAECLRKEVADLLEGGGDLTQADLDVSEAVVHIYLGEFDKAEELLNQARARLSKLKVSPEQESRVEAIRARLHNNLGYLQRVQSRYIAAVKNYRLAIPLWRKLIIETEHANTLTNLGYALARLGRFDAARRLIRDALNLHRSMGLIRPLALAINARAEVELSAGEYLEAQDYATWALEIAKQIPFPRGAGLAHITLASCYRFMSEPPCRKEERLKFLKEALDHSKEALKIFPEEVQEPERLANAYYVRGIAHREFCHTPMLIEEEEVEKHSRQAEEDLTKAMEIAEENNLWEHYLDAAMGLAWLYYYLNQEEKLKAHLQKIEEEIHHRFPAYLITEERFPKVQDDTLLGVFTQMARMHVLKGVKAMDAFEGSEKKPPYEELKAAAREFAIAMEYDHLIADDFRDLRRAMNVIYDRLKGLNAEEMQAFYEAVRETAGDFKWERCHFLEKLEDHFGPYEVISEFGV